MKTRLVPPILCHLLAFLIVFPLFASAEEVVPFPLIPKEQESCYEEEGSAFFSQAIQDPLGNWSDVQFDEQGKLKRLELPYVQDEEGRWQRPVYEFHYDSLGNLTSWKDFQGNCRKVCYNHRGQLSEVRFSEESKRSLDVQKQISAPSSFWSEFELLDWELCSTHTAKDEMGQTIQVRTFENEGRILEVTYDALGRPVIVNEELPSGEFVQRSLFYNLSGQPVYQETLFENGELTSQQFAGKASLGFFDNEISRNLPSSIISHPRAFEEQTSPSYVPGVHFPPPHILPHNPMELDSKILTEVFALDGRAKNTDARVGIVGYGEVTNDLRLTYSNGILNDSSICIASSMELSYLHGGENVRYIHRPTRGFFGDLWSAFLGKLGYTRDHVLHLAVVWKQCLQEMDSSKEKGEILHYAHSAGGIDTFNAALLLTKAERKKISVRTFGTACMIPNKGFKDVQNYIGVRDGVGLIAWLLHPLDATFVGSLWGVPLADHYMKGKTYRSLITRLGVEFMEKHGCFLAEHPELWNWSSYAQYLFIQKLEQGRQEESNRVLSLTNKKTSGEFALCLEKT